MNGLFGRKTQAALRTFQKVEGLNLTGILDGATFDRLVRRVLASLGQAPNTGGRLRGWVIVLDPGHGGGNGTPAKFTGTNREDDNAYDVAIRLKALLQADGARVLLTRPADANASYKGLTQLPARTQLANDAGADLFISIHQNDYPPSSTARGSMVFYSGSDPRRAALARYVERRIVAFTGLKDLGI